jgi:hypothetical protein
MQLHIVRYRAPRHASQLAGNPCLLLKITDYVCKVPDFKRQKPENKENPRSNAYVMLNSTSQSAA